MKKTPAHKNPAIVELCAIALGEMAETCPAMLFASLVTDDGFEIVSHPSNLGNGNLASMSSSVQALGDAVARETEVGTSEFVIIAAEDGHVIQRRIQGQEIVLAAVFDHRETLGKALSISRVIAERLADGDLSLSAASAA